ncbi:MAG: TM0996/MTH895 family glutaredoxin-like protein [Candidatus Cloacimonetes bacterium]|nr:TM0996/MTH895 family glutaredoxin-like protein [Candidatus Cloacimonadota bacterium]
MNIKVLGAGCHKCKQLEKNVQTALENLNINAEVEKVTDISEIMKYNVMMTPALVIDGEVKSVGKVLSPDAIKKLIEN